MKKRVRWKIIMGIFLIIILLLVVFNYNDFLDGFKAGFGR